ncbi:MAG: hypothetical protein IT452_01215 [Planctomycetia bacterium]|nr:hypothetical protein [Planctomycetia bacterium]
MRLSALLVVFLAARASADVLSPVLGVERSGDVLLLRLEGTADVPKDAADWGPLVEVEYSFVPLVVERTPVRLPGVPGWTARSVREGREVPLGRVRARILRDAVEDNPPYLEARPFAVAGLFPGIYRARLAVDPARQSVRLRARGLPAAAAVAEARWGDPADLSRRSREMRLRVEEDAATLQRLARDLEGLWDRWRSAARPGDEWTAELAEWRERMEMLVSRNDRRPGHAIAGWIPAARSAIGEACAAMQALAAACEQAMAQSPEKRRGSGTVEAAATRANRALEGLERAAGRRDASVDASAAREAARVLRSGAREPGAWLAAHEENLPGHGDRDWAAWSRNFEETMTDALFCVGRACPPSAYAELAAVARLLLADNPPSPGRNPSLLSACRSRILRESGGRPDEAWMRACELELESRLGRLEKALGPE